MRSRKGTSAHFLLNYRQVLFIILLGGITLLVIEIVLSIKWVVVVVQHTHTRQFLAPKFVVSEKTTKNTQQHRSCFEPNPHPISPYKQIPVDRVINVGFPKIGSTSMQTFFSNMTGDGSRTASHWTCNPSANVKRGFCGTCIQKAIQKGRPPLATCGNFTVFAQMDYTSFDACIYPQIQYLEEIYKENPTGTLLLPFRSMPRWTHSLRSWHEPGTRERNHTMEGKPYLHPPKVNTENSLFNRMSSCNFSQYNFHADLVTPKTDKEFEKLFCKHVMHIRRFVRSHESLSLVEFNIENPDLGAYLNDIFPSVSNIWGHVNANYKY